MFSFFTLKYYVNKTSCYMLPSSQGTVGFTAAAGSHELLLKHKYVYSPQGSKSLTSKTLGGPLRSGGANPIPNPHIPLRFHCRFQSVRARHLPPKRHPKTPVPPRRSSLWPQTWRKTTRLRNVCSPGAKPLAGSRAKRKVFFVPAARTWLTETDCGFSLCQHDFFPGSLAFSDIPKTCTFN